MTLEDILQDNPELHEAAPGVATSWQLHPEALEFIRRKVTADCVTLETGAGVSTVVFALLGTEHHCIVPDEALVARIRSYCQSRSISVDRVNFLIGPSESVLPCMRLENVDLALIDGRHAFPSPAIDWYYMSRMLKTGGLLLIDDRQLWPCESLVAFLRSEPDWEAEQMIRRTAVFRKTAEIRHERDWRSQPYVFSMSRRSMLRYRIRLAAEMAASGEFSKLFSGIRRALAP